jgi:nitrite reductase/ring-hydroxylating ferredoxin subunit
MTRYEACSTDQVNSGDMISVTLGGVQVLIANVEGQFYALNDLCPHLAVPMSQGGLKDMCVVCPGHGSQFELATGKVLKWVGREPTLLGSLLGGKARHATTYPVTVENDRVYVDI